jgi:mono/diheme cytochrome c family protein
MDFKTLNSILRSAVLWSLLMSVMGAFADEAQLGHDLYHELCSGCHGQEMMHPGLAFDLKKFPADDPIRFSNSVLNGKPPGMPAWRSQLNEEDVRLLWAYVKSGG